MPVCHRNKFIFLHIPRCAGTSIEKQFSLRTVHNCFGVVQSADQVITLHHLTGQDLLAAGVVDTDTFTSYFKFTIIRDPFERMASDYLWQQQFDVHGEFEGLSFTGFLEKAEQIMKQGRYFEKLHYDHFRPMVDYCYFNGQLMVDDILLIDSLDQDLARIGERIGSSSMLHENRSHTTYSHLDCTENRGMVYELYSLDKQLYDEVVDTVQVA